MARIKLTLFFLVLITGIAEAQVNRYMVFFTDKANTGYTVDHPEAFLNERAIERRTKQGIDILAEDLPVAAAYVQGVRATGAKVLYKSKWMNGVLVECTAEQLTQINSLLFVKSAETELVAPGGATARQNRTNKFREARGNEDVTTDELSMLGIDEMHLDGYHGEGVLVAIMDGGFFGFNIASPFQDALNNHIDQGASWNFVGNNSNVFSYDDHGTGVLSVMAVYKADQYTGASYNATFQLYVTEDVSSEYRIEEYNWLFAAERADSAGVDVINTSLGYNTFDDVGMDYTTLQMDGKTAVITRAAEIAAKKGIFLVNSAGNSGSSAWGIVTAPADGESVLAIGNIRLDGTRVLSSSTGPTADDRIKPDVVAFGAGVSAFFGSGNIGNRTGTSFSSPLVAGLVVGLRQRYPDLTRAELMEAIKMSASQASSPNNQLGYGIPHYRSVVNYLEVTRVDSEQYQSLTISPNPVQDTFTLAPRTSSMVRISELAIANAQGQVVLNTRPTDRWPGNLYSVNMTNFIPGVYFLTVRIGSKYETYKLIKI